MKTTQKVLVFVFISQIGKDLIVTASWLAELLNVYGEKIGDIYQN